NTLLFSTYLGGSKGSSGDHGYGIAVDGASANIYVAGSTDSYDFPTANPLQLYNANGDAFVAKINMATASPAIMLTPDTLAFDFQAGGTSSTPKTITLTNVGNAALTISAISLNSAAFNQTNTCGTLPASLGAGANCTINVVYSPPISGNWSATLVVSDSSLASPHRVTITSAGANVALASSLNPSAYGQAVTLTATVSSSIPGGPLKGTVQFFDGPNTFATQPLVSGTATFVSPVFLPGTHNFTAVYSGDGFRSGSNPSNVVQQIVNPAATTTAVTSSLNPSAFGAGAPPTFTATVTENNGLTTVEGGTVVFKDGAVTLGTGTILPDDTGQTTFTPASNTVLALGTHPITAIYQGNAAPANWAGSTSAILNQVVAQPTSTTLAAQINGKPLSGTAYFTRNPAQRLILTITVTGNSGTPAGSVALADGAVTLGTAILSPTNPTTATATFQVTGLPVGLNQVNAVFPPSGPYAGSTSNTVMVYQSPRPKIR